MTCIIGLIRLNFCGAEARLEPPNFRERARDAWLRCLERLRFAASLKPQPGPQSASRTSSGALAEGGLSDQTASNQLPRLVSEMQQTGRRRPEVLAVPRGLH